MNLSSYLTGRTDATVCKTLSSELVCTKCIYNQVQGSAEDNIQISTPKGNQERQLTVRQSIDRLSIIPKIDKSFVEENEEFEVSG